MIISHKYRFIFIKTRKTAGTSIEVFLSQYCDSSDVLTPIYPHFKPHVARNSDRYFNHMSASAVRDSIGNEIWENYLTFCVERNPWDKTLSYYHMLNAKQGGSLTLDDYLLSGDFCTDYRAYTDPKNPSKIVVDHVLRYDSLNSELGVIFEMLGIPYDGNLGVYAKSEYRTDRRPYREVYLEYQAEVIKRAFKNEIGLFGFRF
jgi:hypothetical protein